MIDTFPHPVRTWRQLGTAGKFLWYTRLSLQLSVVFLPFLFLVALVSSPDVPGWLHWTGAVVLVVSAVSAVAAIQVREELTDQPRPDTRGLFLAGLAGHLLVLAVCLVPQYLDVSDGILIGSAFIIMGLTMNVSVAFIPFLPHRWWVAFAVTVIVGGSLLRTMGTNAGSIYFTLSPVFFVGLTALSVWTAGLMLESDRARRLEADLKVSEERLRFAQELHDTLGQHLAAMSIKAELAQKFAERGDDRLLTELADLRALTGTTLSEMREVIQGYRSINLATEIEGARALLRDAGVELHVTGHSVDVPESARELAAWFVRETTTNVLRHADATAVALTLSPTRVRVRNDGGRGGVDKLGGLAALRRRAADLGAHLTVEHGDGDFTVTLEGLS